MEATAALVDLFAHHMPMGIAIFDNRLILQRSNPTWLAIIEAVAPVPEDELPGLSLAALLPDAADTVVPYARRALAGETVVENGLRIASRDAIFYWDAAFTPVRTAESITGFSLVATDVTNQVLTRQLLERHVADRTRKLSALYDVMTIAAEPVQLKQILHQSLTRVLTAVQANAGLIQLLDSRGDRLHAATQINLPDEVVDDLQTIAAQHPFFGKLVDDWSPVVLKDLSGNPHLPDSLRRSGLRAFAGLQMNAKGNVVGILSLFRERKRPYSQEDIALLDSVADQIGIAVENARLRKENEQLLVLQERNRLARALHDAVTQSLYSMTLFAEANRRFARDGNLPMAGEYAARLSDTAQQALREMRLLLHNLRPSILEQVGLIRAIQQRLDGVEQRAGVQTHLQISGSLLLPPHVEEALYHIAQEGLNNALKHAVASVVTVTISQHDEQVELHIVDDGRGFDLMNSDDNGGLGLTSMRERVELLGGILKLSSEPNQGTTIAVRLDLDHVGDPATNVDIHTLLR